MSVRRNMGSRRCALAKGGFLHAQELACPSAFVRVFLIPALAVAAAFVLALATAPAPSAFADEVEPAENLVNPQQLPDSSFIYDTLISDLAQADSYLDGQTVQVTGEVVGDSIRAEFDRGYRWITVQANDGSYSQIAVFMTDESAERIDTFGAYGKVGTTLQVRGTFNLACSQHEGLSDLHANHVTVVEKGHADKPDFDFMGFVPGLVLVAIGLVSVVVFYRLRERLR